MIVYNYKDWKSIWLPNLKSNKRPKAKRAVLKTAPLTDRGHHESPADPVVPAAGGRRLSSDGRLGGSASHAPRRHDLRRWLHAQTPGLAADDDCQAGPYGHVRK